MNKSGVSDRKKTIWARAIKERDSYICQDCGNDCEKSLAIAHHIIPAEDGGEYTMENGTTLCPSCHGKAHRRLRLENRMWSDFERRFFLAARDILPRPVFVEICNQVLGGIDTERVQDVILNKIESSGLFLDGGSPQLPGLLRWEHLLDKN